MNELQNDMQQVGGVWLPAHEKHMVEWMDTTNEVVDGRLTYQHGKLLEAMKWVKAWDLAVDIGAHVGTWSLQLAPRFKHLEAFEPESLHAACFRRNLDGLGNWSLHNAALWDTPGHCDMLVEHGSSGNTKLVVGTHTPMHCLDHYNLPACDFIKVDCNGSELPALAGGIETIKRFHPCISVEQKHARVSTAGQPQDGAIAFLHTLGAQIRHEHGGVYVMSWSN